MCRIKDNKKSCHSVECKTELLEVIHIDLAEADLRQTMSRGGKKNL